MVMGDSRCRGQLLLLTKPDAIDSSLGCSTNSSGRKPFLSGWEWAIPVVLWVFTASAATFSAWTQGGRELTGIVRGDTSVYQGI